MLQRWKLILTNWNNCYFSEISNDEPKININSLLNIISHLRQNLNLDESKSSTLESHTVKEFLIEKYPDFKFENGSVEPSSEDEIYIVASLLLFFVCVNSKDVHIKNAMCSKLSSEDQKTILKFSKSLLECPAISCRDVQAAITEACGQDLAAMEVPRRATIAETPPALRSLHSEVRRLQAALDAERFDRNYLQEELGRTNARLDRLLKEKEQYKLDIVNLKAKISLCCGEESEAKGAEVAADRSAQLMKQLHKLEEKLVATQGELDDVLYQRDSYKAKVDELKQERDKWLALSLEETSRACQLSEELETERRQNQTLKELVVELKQHNRLNGLDSSSLECDDPDASIHSLPHNTSVCSEACANVIEVQLGEERAKVVELKHQIQTLQDQIIDLNKKSEAEKLALKDVVAEREHNIFNLKHRINEEIENMNHLKTHYDNEITKLNNEINEMEQTLKENTYHSRAVIEKKMEEIKNLQEEKISLLQSLNDETTKLENVIKDLKAEIETEKQAKSNMKDSYENHLMKLNEKVLKRNNEIVEFQNNICEKSEMIETLQMQLKQEKETTNVLGDYCNKLNTQKYAIENDLQLKIKEINELEKKLQNRITTIESLNVEISNLKTNVSNMNDKCRDLEFTNDKLLSEIKERDLKIEKAQQDIENIKDKFFADKEKLVLDLDERNETVNSLQVQLKNEIDFKMELQKELSQLKSIKETLTENLEQLNTELTALKDEMENKEKTIDAMDLCIQGEKKFNEQASENMRLMTEDNKAKEKDIELLHKKLESVNEVLQEETKNKCDLLANLESLNDQVKSQCIDNTHLHKQIAVKCQEILMLRDEVEELSQKLDEKEKFIQELHEKLLEECKKYDDFELNIATEMTKLAFKINETNNIATECANILSKEIIEKDSIIKQLNENVDVLKEALCNAEMDIRAYVDKLNLELTHRVKLEEDYQIQFRKIDNLTTLFNSEIETRDAAISKLNSEIQILTEEKSEGLKALQAQIKKETEAKNELAYQKQCEIKKLQTNNKELEALNEEIEQELKTELESKAHIIKSLKQEIEQLQNTIEEDNSVHEVLVKGKDALIDKLEQEVKGESVKSKDLHEYIIELKSSWEEYKSRTVASLKEKDEEIIKLKNKILALEQQIETQEQCKNTLNKQIARIEKRNKEIENNLTEEKSARDVLQTEKVQLLNENKITKSENEQLQIQINRLSEEVIQDKTVIKTSEDEKNALISEKIQIKESLAKEQAITCALLQDKECLTQQLVEERNSKEIAEKERDNLADEKKTLQDNFEQEEQVKSEICHEMQVLTKQIEELQQNYEEEKKALCLLLEKEETLNKDLDLAKANYHYLLEENRDLVIENDNLKAEKLDLVSKVTELEEELSKMTKTYYDLELKLGENQNELKVLETRLKEKDEEIIRLLGKYNLSVEENDQIRGANVSLTLSLNTEKANLENLDKEKSILVKQIKELVAEITKMRNQHDTVQEILTNKQKEHENIGKQLYDKDEQIVNLLDKNSKLTETTEQLHIQYDLLNKSLMEEKSARDNLEIENAYLKANLKELNTEINELHKANNETKEMLTQKQNEMDDIETKLNENVTKLMDHNNTLLQETEKLLQEREKLLQERDSLSVSLTDEKSARDVLETEKNTVEKKLFDLQVEFEEMKSNLNTMKDTCLRTTEQKDKDIFELKTEINRLQQIVNEKKIEALNQTEKYSTSVNAKIKDIQTLQQENQALHNDLNDVKLQLELKVHSLKEKLTDNENLTDKLKKTYECQIDNLNMMVTKLTNYLKDKTEKIESLKKDKVLLSETIEENRKSIKLLEDEIKTEKQNIDKIITDFESERQVLKNMVTVTESVMEDQKTTLSNVILQHLKDKETIQAEVNELTKVVRDNERKRYATESAYASVISLLRRERIEKDLVERESELLREYLDDFVIELKKERNKNVSSFTTLESQNKALLAQVDKYKNDIDMLQKSTNEINTNRNVLDSEIKAKSAELSKISQEKTEVEKTLQKQRNDLSEKQKQIDKLQVTIESLIKEKEYVEKDKTAALEKLEELKLNRDSKELIKVEEMDRLNNVDQELLKTMEENKTVISNLELLHCQCSTLQDYHDKAEIALQDREKEINSLQKEIETLQAKVEIYEQESKAKDGLISRMSKEKDAIINTISKELLEEKMVREKCEKEIEIQMKMVHDLKNNTEIKVLKKENEQLIRAIGQQETFAAMCHEKAACEKYQQEHRENPQVDSTSSDNTQSSIESVKTITDLEKIIHDRNRTITTLQTDITYMKSLMAESETKLLDVNKELEVSKENCHQLSNQLKKLVHQKNEEIAEQKKQISKMSLTENRASQIIKVSAKYQAIILKRIAEIKSNTILKELTNFGNTNTDNIRGTVTMEDLENFLETTDRHLKRCAEKQIALQKERDRLTEVNRINESEIINLKKFLTELSVSFQTFSSVKDMYAQKLSRVISVQRTVRREILNLDSRITDAAMCKLERGYAAVMQDLAECAMNLERWVERCISRTVSVEKIKQAFVSDSERTSLASPTYQNTGLEIQLEELDKSFQKLLEEVARTQKGDGARDTQAMTVMEVRAEYEDKLNRMKAKMKELFNEQMTVFKEKHREEISLLERELQKTRSRMEESKQEYEKHIRQLTKELWSVGEKYLVKNDEAEWLRKKQRSGSLMSLQHVHSSGLIPPPEPPSRPSDAASLRSLPVTNKTNKRDGRQMHMSDEEGEVFDNRWLKELSATPRREPPPGQRVSELKWRNSLCPPHLKSSYPAETQFAPDVDEDDLKVGAAGPVKPQRKEVGITAYKKPGPPTPSKQAGRLSATGSELRESLRVEQDPHTDRKTSTPARLRNFLRFNKNDTTEGTPRTRRLSNIFRKNR